MVSRDKRLKLAWRIREANFPPTIAFDYPFNTAVISLTGPYCGLDCAHCGGEYLKGMMPIWRARLKGATSCLISGGCDPQGRVPVTSHLEEVRAIREGRVMNWHVGLIGREEVEAIAPYVDLVSFDFLSHGKTIREVYGLDRGADDYGATYSLLREHFPVVPHITIGLRGGEVDGEYQAMEMLGGLSPEALTLLVFTPTPGTRYADRKPPELEAVADLIAETRIRFPTAYLYLGCLRPRGEYRQRLDRLALLAGVNGIVSPAREASLLAQERGLRVERREECCAVGWWRYKGEEDG